MNEITVKALTENLNIITEFVDTLLEEKNCSMKAQMQIDVAIDEIFSNIVNYAYDKEVGDVTLRVLFPEETKIVRLQFTDSGIPYNPLEKDDPDTTLSAEEREIGGLGIFLVKKTMDEIVYTYEDGCNKLLLIKNMS